MTERLVVQTLIRPDEPVDPRVDAVELRLDLYPALDAAALIERCPLPVIATVRRQRDGGAWEGEEKDRAHLLRSARGAAYIDVEWDADPGLAPEGPRRIVSHHDCAGVPGDLDGIVERCRSVSADRVKIAVTPRDAAEALRLLDLPCDLIGMGPYARFTRVLSRLTYCASRPVAPGMPTPGELFDDFRIARLGDRPALLGVAGDPIEHSRSPQFHNPLLERDGLQAVYLRFRVARLAEFWVEFIARGGRGLSITAPLKEQAAALATTPSREVTECGAANTLLSDGRAFNTDVLAFLELIPPRTTEALVMGAGGAARAAITALRRIGGCRVRAWARRREAVEALGVEYAAQPEATALVINTTPVSAPEAGFLIDLRYGPDIAPPPQGAGGLAFLEAQARHQYRLFAEHLRHG